MRALKLASIRLLEALVVLLVLASLVFFALRLLPGDPAQLILGDQAGPAELARLRARLHLDESLARQYVRFLAGLASLDLGDSLRRPGVPALRRVGEALGPTGALAGVAVAIGSVTGVGLAMLSVGPWLGKRRAWIERGLVTLAATPLLSFAPVLTYALSARLRLVRLPGDPDAGVPGLIFASALLAIPLAAQVGRTGRAALTEVAPMLFLRVVKAKGATDGRVWWKHALPAASGPILTVVATQLGALLGGAVVLERLFERWGLGTLILEAYSSRDLPVLEGAVVASGGIFVLVQAVAAALHAMIDPEGTRVTIALPARRLLPLLPLGLVVTIAAFAASLVTASPSHLEPRLSWCSPDLAHPLGCGEGGVDLFSLIAHATLRAIALACIVAALGLLVGAPLGALAALARGRFERGVGRAADLIQAFPTFLLALVVLSAVRSPSRVHLGFVFAATAWAPFARLALAQTRVLRDATFVEAAFALGLSRANVVVRHLVPHLLGVVAVQLGATGAAIVVSEAALAFVGLGPRDGVSLGAVMDQGVAAMLRAPHVLTVGAASVFLTSVSLLIAGRAIESPRLSS